MLWRRTAAATAVPVDHNRSDFVGDDAVTCPVFVPWSILLAAQTNDCLIGSFQPLVLSYRAVFSDAVVRQPCDRTDPIVTEHEAEASSGRQIRIEWNREHVPLHSQVHNVDRYLEEAMFKAVAAAGLAPPLLGFDHYHAGILARGWIDGAHSLSVDECREGTRALCGCVHVVAVGCGCGWLWFLLAVVAFGCGYTLFC